MSAPAKWVACLAAGLCLAGCGEDTVLAPPNAAVSSDVPSAVGALTWNVYVGDDIESVLVADDPQQIPFLVAQAFADVQATDFPARAGEIARQIAAARPHVVGLQEVSLFRTQSPGDFLVGNPQAAQDVALDYLQILLDALAARGATYQVAGVVQNFDLEVPIATHTGLDDIRLTDFDVLLARPDVQVDDVEARNYGAAVPVTLGGITVPILRGFVSARVTVDGRRYRVVNTHLEPAEVAPGVIVPDFQIAQAGELLAELDEEPEPVILLGDFNSAADGSSTPTYGMVLGRGFVDTWTVGRVRGDGFTANQPPDLRNVESQLFHRIDFVFYRDEGTRADGRLRGVVHAELIGEEAADRTASGLWPSDHAGLSALLLLAPGH